MKLEKIIKFFLGGWIAFVITCVPAWFTHVVVCFRAEEYILLIAGAIAFPIAVFHGWWIWITGILNFIMGLF